MPKIGMEHVRRRQIIAATRACLTRLGLEATSLPAIAREAAIAPSLIQHYFRDRDDLLTETFRALYRAQSDRIRRGLARAATPEDRLAVLLEALTRPELPLAEHRACLAAMGAFRSDRLDRVARVVRARLAAHLRQNLPAIDPRLVLALAQGLAAQDMPPDQAQAMLHDEVSRHLPAPLPPRPDETKRRATEDAALSPEARGHLTANLPLSHRPYSASSALALRQEFDRHYAAEARAASKALGVKVQKTTLGPIPAVMVQPKGGARLGLFHLFGGGHANGGPASDLGILGGLACRLGLSVVAPRLRLAPEAPFPADLEDAITAWESLAEPLLLVGQGSGGGLALALLQHLKARGLPLPKAVALMSPWVDLTPDLTADLTTENDGHDPALSRRNLRDYARLYAGAHDLRDPRLSPLHGDLFGLPPILLTTGSRDILRPQIQALARGLTQSGTKVTLHDRPGHWHVIEFYHALPEAAQNLDLIARFLRNPI